MSRIPTLVLGGTGYVAGELMRILAGHPGLEIVGVMSESSAGARIRDVFKQLQSALGDLRFDDKQAMLGRIDGGQVALFSAAPHGASAALVGEFIQRAEQTSCELTVVDVSADFRFASNDAYAAVYGTAHGAPEHLDKFSSALPEHIVQANTPHIGHPGCFASALLLASVPLMKLGLTQPDLFAVGVTGSTGSGRTPAAGTHHPERQSNMFAYKPLNHRHAPEVMSICESVAGTRPDLHFIPHSGPFSRGIHLTMQATLNEARKADDIRQALHDFYAQSEFVEVIEGTPKIKDIVGSNYCHIGVATDDRSLAVFVVIDNLVKGAAGGAVQWMNRQLGYTETDGLLTPALGWI